MNKKGFLQISFAWLFAIIVGIAIISLAIYGVSKLIGTQEDIQGAKTSKEIGILLNPLETGFEEAKTNTIGFPVNTRMFNKCSLEGSFGKQLIQISQKSFNEWTETDINVGFENKYIFSNEMIEGEKMIIFTKPFEFPFKIADLMYITSANKKYCFKNAPEDIEEELSTLSIDNVILEGYSEDDECDEDMINVCFSNEDCDININYNRKSIDTKGGRVYFEGDVLMYAGIFSEKEVYECHLKRLMMRLDVLSTLYKEKIALTGCGENLKPELNALISATQNFKGSQDLNQIKSLTDALKNRNRDLICKIF